MKNVAQRFCATLGLHEHVPRSVRTEDKIYQLRAVIEAEPFCKLITEKSVSEPTIRRLMKSIMSDGKKNSQLEAVIHVKTRAAT